MSRSWQSTPQSKDIPGGQSSGVQFARKSPVLNSWLDSGGLPSNKTGEPFDLDNGLLDGIWVGSDALLEYEISVYWHEGNETNLTLLTMVTVLNTNRTLGFDAVDLGVITLPKNIQLATRLTDFTTSAPKNLKCYLRPIGDAA